jgi:hypothetical protein
MGKDCSGRGHQNTGSGRGIKTDGTAVDLYHALLPTTLTQQFQFRPWQDPEIGHFRAGLSVALNGAHPEPAVAAGFG